MGGAGSQTTSPSLRPLSRTSGPGDEWSLGGSRDESAFYQAETQMLTRENQMLKQRIRELERQINDLSGPSVERGADSTAPAGPT
ncbi:hypothetical protein LTR66_004379 [Elasticomyces elasticus]|nr:hypothetical protein LTR66_004379 [Elasticomyces elasticus]